LNNGLKNVIERIGCKTANSHIEKTINYLEDCKRKSGVAQNFKTSKENEVEFLENFISENNFWYTDLDFSIFLDEGAEQKVFFNEKTLNVIKINDAIFYENWTDYLINLCIHNCLFPHTSYTLLGFLKINSTLYSAVQQNYIEPTELTKIELVRKLMLQNGFINNKNNDYYHDTLGIIIEDLHEENVLTSNGLIYFIDTVIYIR
jgi:Serine/Threonine/Tyrosine Kinase found in polyvalent proteins